jgi:hypothetical protein
MKAKTPSAFRLFAPGLLARATAAMAIGVGGLVLPWQETQRITPSDGAFGDAFGASVALSGSQALIGANQATWRPGAAYVFVRLGELWIEETKLAASDGGFDDRFGDSVGLDGDAAVVGAKLAEVDGNAHQGAVYVFERMDGVWTEQQKLTASDGAKQDTFGSAVAIEGDTVMVSAPSDDIGGNSGQGSIYVFVRQGSAWVEQQKIVISDGQPSDLLGLSDIAIQGDRAVVGAPSATVDGVNNKGAVYVLVRVGGVWLEEARLTAAAATEPISFGSSVALDGARVVAGARGDTDTAEAQGTAYVFDKIGDTWVETQRIVASDAQEFGLFGRRAATYGGRILVAGRFDTPGNPGQGAVYFFRRDGAEWVEVQKVTASDGAGIDGFGSGLAIGQDVFLAGASGSGVAGAAYFFRRTPLFADGFESEDTSAWSQTVP